MGDGRVLFDHIAIAMDRIADAGPILAGALGGIPDAGAPSRAFNWGCWRFAGGGRLEVIEPRGADGFLHRFLAQRGAGIHHVTFRVPSLTEACARAEANGYKVVGYEDRNPHWKEAFLHPKQALGIVVQLAESAGGASPWRWDPPRGSSEPPPPVTIVGLRLRARSRERAAAQWGDVLQGVATEGEQGEVIYRWPESPMRLTVEVDPGRDEGPICIEFTADRAVTFPATVLPVVGAVFARSPDR
jgi:methylmalonyl-CoA/ethylmalonyl-CoA epimerase